MTMKEEFAVILDFLPNGYPFDKRPLHVKTAIAQALGKENLVLLELVPKKDCFLQPHEDVYIGEGKRDKIHHIASRIAINKSIQSRDYSQMGVEVALLVAVLKLRLLTLLQ